MLARAINLFMNRTYDWAPVHHENNFPLIGPSNHGELGEGTGQLQLNNRGL